LDEVIHNSVHSALLQMEEQEHGHDHGGGVSSNNRSKNIKKAIRKIRSKTFRTQVRRLLEDFHPHPTFFVLDANIDLLVFANGVYDFTQKKFRAIRPSDRISCENGLQRIFPTEATEEAQKDFIQTFRSEFATVVAVRPNTPEYVIVTAVCPRCKSENSHGAPKGARRVGARVCDGCPYEYYIKLEEDTVGAALLRQ
jgi:hypothetical protein